MISSKIAIDVFFKPDTLWNVELTTFREHIALNNYNNSKSNLLWKSGEYNKITVVSDIHFIQTDRYFIDIKQSHYWLICHKNEYMYMYIQDG